MTIHYCDQEDLTDVFFFVPLTEEPCDHHQNNHSGCYPSTTGNPDLQIQDNNCDNAHCENHNADDPYRSDSPEASGYPDCCSDTVLFLAIEEDYVKAESSEIDIQIILPLFVSENNQPEEAASNNTLPATSIKKHPPGLQYGKHLVYLNRQLLL